MFSLLGLMNNGIATLVLWLMYFTLITFILGRIVQNRTKLFHTDYSMAIPIGFVVYFLTTFTLYLIPSMFDATTVFYIWLEAFKDLALVLIAIVFFKDWVPTSYYKLDKRQVYKNIYLFSVIAFIIGMVYVFESNFDWFNEIWSTTDLAILEDINYSIANENLAPSVTYMTGQAGESYNSNQVFFYWVIGSLATDALSLELFIYYLMPIIILIVSIFAFHFYLEKFHNTNFNYFVLLIGSFALMLIFGITSPINGIQMALALNGIAMISIIYHAKYTSKNQYILFAITNYFLLFFIIPSGLMIFTVIGLTLILYSWQFKTTILNLSIYWTLLETILLTLFFYSISIFGAILTMVFGLLIFASLITYKINRERANLEKYTEKSRSKEIVILLLVATIILTAIFLPSSLKNNEKPFQHFFTEQLTLFSNPNVNKNFNSFIVTMALMIASYGVILAIFKDKKKPNERFYALVGFIVIGFYNPISYIWLDKVFLTNQFTGNMFILVIFPTFVLAINIMENMYKNTQKFIVKRYNFKTQKQFKNV